MNLFPPLNAPSSLSVSTPGTSPAKIFNADSSSWPGDSDPNALTPSFSQTLQNAFSHVNDLQIQADDKAQAFATGQTSDIHSVMIAAEQATIALQLTAQIRNKAIDAYQEIMRTSM